MSKHAKAQRDLSRNTAKVKQTEAANVEASDTPIVHDVKPDVTLDFQTAAAETEATAEVFVGQSNESVTEEASVVSAPALSQEEIEEEKAITTRLARLVGYIETMRLSRTPSTEDIVNSHAHITMFIRFELSQDLSKPLNRKVLKRAKELFIEHAEGVLAETKIFRAWHLYGSKQSRDEASWLISLFYRFAVRGQKVREPDWTNHELLVHPRLAEVAKANLRELPNL